MSSATPTKPPYRTIVDALFVLVRDGHVLLAQRQGTGYADGAWIEQKMASRSTGATCGSSI